MGQLVSGVVGAVVGYVISGGNPYGAVVGFQVGSGAYALLNQPKYLGPRLADLNAPKVDEGTVITIIEGHPRVPGIPIWQSEAIEHEHSEGGKGTPVQTTYSYTRHVMFLVADGVIGGVAQAFENGKLVWTNLADADEASLEASAENDRFGDLIVYLGADDQDPDPTYEAAVGVGMAPAYTRRGTVMLLDVACDAGGRIGNWQFVVNGQAGDSNALKARLILPHYATPTDIHSRGASVGNGLTTKVCKVINGAVVTCAGRNSMTFADIIVETDTFPAGVTRGMGRGSGDRPFLVFGTSEMSFAGFAMVGDGISKFVSLQDNTDYLGETDIRWSTHSDRIAIGSAAAIGTGADDLGDIPTDGAKGKVYLYNIDATYLDSETIGTPIESIAMTADTVWALSDGDVYPLAIAGDAFTAGTPFAPPAGSDHALVVSSGGVLHAVNAAQQVYSLSGTSWTLVTTLDAEDDSDLSPYSFSRGSCTHYSIVGSRIYAVTKDDQEIIEAPPPMFIWVPDIVGTSNQIENYYGSLDSAVHSRGLPNWINNVWLHANGLGEKAPVRGVGWLILSQAPFSGDMMGNHYIDEYQVKYFYEYYSWFNDDIGVGYRWQAAERTENYASRDWAADGGVHYKLAHAVYRQSLTPLSELIEPPLSDVIRRACLRAGLEEDDIETAPEMDDIFVHAMAIGTQSNGRGVLDALKMGYGIDYYEGPKIKFVMRGTPPVLTINYADLGAHGDGEDLEPLNIKPPSSLDIPQKFAIKYSKLNKDYQPGVAYADREIGDASGITYTELPLTLTPTEAQKIVEMQKLDARLASIRIELSLTDDYLHLECTDVITVVGRNGNRYHTRIDRTSEGDGMKLQVVFDDATIFEQTGASHNEEESSTVVTIAPLSVSELLDIPIQSDADNDAGFYGVAKGATTPYPGSWLWDVTGDPVHIASFTASAVFGTCTSVLGDWTGPRIIDEINSVDVDVGAGTMSSSTYTAVINDATINRMMIGDEEVQPIVCTLLSAGKYRLRRFLRGCRGTEWAMTGHVASERCVKLGAGLRRVPMESGRLGAERSYKTVTLGRQMSGATTEAFTNNGVGLKPFSPVRLRVVRDSSGNIVFYWQRRSRLACRLIGPLGISVPLGEETEAYTVTVYTDNTYATVKRTIPAFSESIAYSAATQTSDFGSPQSPVYWGVQMLSATVGAGYEERMAA